MADGSGKIPVYAVDMTAVPHALRESVLRHQRHLAELIVKFRSAGLDETLIDTSVQQLVRSYESELLAAIHDLVKDAGHA